MKSLPIALVVFVVSLPVGGAQPRVADRELAGLNGPVHTVSVDVAPLATVDATLVAAPRSHESVEEYDRRGDLVASSSFASGTIVERDTFRYASDGSRLGEASVRPSAAVFAVVSTSADRSKHASAWHTSVTKAINTYDERGYRLASVVVDGLVPGAAEVSRESFVYDEEGRVVETRRLAADGSTIESTRIVYETGGRPSSTEIRHANGSLASRVEYADYVLDAKGNWTYRTELETDARGDVRERRARWREIDYFAALVSPAKRDPKRPAENGADVASASRPRRVHPLGVRATEAPSETIASSLDELNTLTVEVSDDGSDVRYVVMRSSASPYGLTRPRRVFPLRRDDSTFTASTGDGTPAPHPSPEQDFGPVPALYGFTDVPTR